MTPQAIPLVDLKYQHAQIEREIREGFDEVLSDSSFVLGPQVKEFEKNWSRYCDTNFAVGVGNGTDAIELALRAAGVGKDNEVIVPANTFVATASAVLRTGATLVLADCDDDFLLGPETTSKSVTEKTKAVIGVHLFGQAAPMEAIRNALSKETVLIEDMAQAQGARRFGVRVGGLGMAAATSFYPGKNLGAFGDAGAVTTNSHEIARHLRRLRNHGGEEKYEHVELGFNSRMDTLQAVVLNAKLACLDDWNRQRRQAAKNYELLLGSFPDIRLPGTLAGNEHVFHLYVIRVKNRDHVVRELRAKGIGAGVHYPSPIHLLPAYSFLNYRKGSFPEAEAACDDIVSIPMFPGITPDQQEQVAQVLSAATKRSK